MLFKAKTLYSYWLKIYRKIGKPERFGTGDRIDALLLETLDLIHSSRYASLRDKIPHLEKTISKIDKTRFFAEIAWENKLITSKEYSEFLIKLEEIGRTLGGWKKGIVNKNSQP